MAGFCVASHLGEVTAEDIRAAGDGVVCLVDCVAEEYDCVAAYNGGVAIYAAGYVQTSEENECAAGQVAFNLHGAEETHGVMDLLARGYEDVLSEVDAIASRLGVGGGDEQNRETENPSCAV